MNIKIKDLDFDNRIVYVNVTKNRKPLIIPLNEDIVKILHEYLKYRQGQPDAWLFISTYGDQLNRSSCYHGLGITATIAEWIRQAFIGSVIPLRKNG